LNGERTSNFIEPQVKLPPDIAAHRTVQAAAKRVLAALANLVGPLDTERTIARRAVELLADEGIADTWYYDCPAYVLVGSRSCLSISGREYEPADEPVGDYNLVTVDLSPSLHGVWGDCARSFYVESGRCLAIPQSPEFVAGAALQCELHEQLLRGTTRDTTCGEAYSAALELIRRSGYECLDFLANVGHSIERSPADRIYLEPENPRPLGDLGLFTFEPHIRKLGGRWGFKHENIYYFGDDGRLTEL
jgi:Xaa-Pro aminopeptidase